MPTCRHALPHIIGVPSFAGTHVYYGAAIKDTRCSVQLWNDPSLSRAAAEAKCNSHTACKGLMWYNNGDSDSQRYKYQGCGGSVASKANTDWDTFSKLTGASTTSGVGETKTQKQNNSFCKHSGIANGNAKKEYVRVLALFKSQTDKGQAGAE